jgi:hypothetical protein
MKKGNEVADNEDDDAVITSVSQDQMTMALCTEELFLSTQYIYSFPTYQKGQTWGEGRLQTVNTIHSAIPAGFLTS